LFGKDLIFPLPLPEGGGGFGEESLSILPLLLGGRGLRKGWDLEFRLEFRI